MKNKYFKQLVEGFTEWLTRLNYAKESIRGRKRHLIFFFKWLEEMGIENLDISRDDMEKYNKYLHARPIKSSTISGYLSVLRRLNDYLESYGKTPIVRVKLDIENEIKIERMILTKSEITRLYESCEMSALGMRDRAMIAIYYGCGLRCSEGTRLELSDIDFRSGLVHIKKGKNYRARYVPMSSGVKKELKTWITEGQYWFSGSATKVILPNSKGKMMDSKSLNIRLKILCKKAEIKKHITLHCLRHSIATHLLESGMDMEKIGQFLGHRSLEATKIYTRIDEEI